MGEKPREPADGTSVPSDVISEQVRAAIENWKDQSTADWENRESSVLDLAYDLALKEVDESTHILDPVKTRATVVFSTVLSAMAFLSGTALRDVERSSLRAYFLLPGILFLVGFAASTIMILLGGRRHLALDAKAVRDQYVQGAQQVPKVSHLWDENVVKSDLIESASRKVDENIEFYSWIRKLFVVQVFFAAGTLAMWSLLVAYSQAKP